MGGKRQNIQYSLALDLTGRGESPLGGHQGTEPPVAKPDPESPALAEQIMEEVCERENCETAWKQKEQGRSRCRWHDHRHRQQALRNHHFDSLGLPRLYTPAEA